MLRIRNIPPYMAPSANILVLKGLLMLINQFVVLILSTIKIDIENNAVNNITSSSEYNIAIL